MKKNLFILLIVLILFPTMVFADGCFVTVTDVIPDGREEIVLGTDTQFENWEAGGSSTYTANEYEGYECKHVIVNDEVKVKSDTVEVQHDDFPVTDLGIKFVYKVATTPVVIPDPEPAPASDPEPDPAPASDPEPEPAPASDPEPEPAPANNPDPEPEPANDPNPEPASEPEPEQAPANDPEPAPVNDPEPAPEQVVEPEPEPVIILEQIVEPEPIPVADLEPEPVVEPEPELVVDPEPEPEIVAPVVVQESEPEPEPDIVPEQVVEPEHVIEPEPQPEPEPVVTQAEPEQEVTQESSEPAPEAIVESASDQVVAPNPPATYTQTVAVEAIPEPVAEPVAQHDPEPATEPEPEPVVQPVQTVASTFKPRYKVQDKKRDAHKIHFEYLDLNGKQLRCPTDTKIHDGDPIFYEAAEIKGYVCVVRPSVYYSYPTGDQEIVFYYARVDEMTEDMEDLSLPYEHDYFKMLKSKLKEK